MENWPTKGRSSWPWYAAAAHAVPPPPAAADRADAQSAVSASGPTTVSG